MSDKGIKLSPKYGVNPTIPICFFCGEEKNEIALMGHIGDGRKHEDIEAPRHMILDYEPCACCKEKFSHGVLIVEVNSYPNSDNQPPLTKNAYPTGRHIVVRPEALNGNFSAGSKALMNGSEFEMVFGDFFRKG